MGICDFPGCEGELDDFLSFKCNYCGGSFCSNHRLPSMHSCSGIDAWKSRPTPSKAMTKRSRRQLIETPKIITPEPVRESASEPTPQSIPTDFDPPPISRSIPKLNITFQTTRRYYFNKIIGVIGKAAIIIFIFGLIWVFFLSRLSI